jgi:glycosyltransferase 2 family protein
LANVGVTRRPSVGLLQAGVSLVTLAGIVLWASRQRAPHIPLDGGAVVELVAALALYAGATALRAERWHAILRRSALERRRSDVYGLTLVGYMGNNVLPARAGDVMRVVMVGGTRRLALGTVVAERLLDVGALALVFGVVVADRRLDWGPLPYIAGAGAIVALALLVVLRLRGLARCREWLRPVVAATRTLAGPAGVGLLGLSVVLWLLEASVYLAVGNAVGIHLGVTGALYVMALTNLSALVPAGPGYIGTYDAAVLLALRSLGQPALGYLLVLRFVLFVPITVAGFAVFLRRHARRAT